jgi:hypothetical protein
MHQIAPKSIKTYLPIKSCNETTFPDVSAEVKSGATAPIAVFFIFAISAAKLKFYPRGAFMLLTKTLIIKYP